MRIKSSAVLLLALAACSPQPAANGATPSKVRELPEEGDACGAGKLGAYLGIVPGDDLTDRIAVTAGHRRIRIIHPGDAVTMDYSPTRLNVELGKDGRIKRLHCG